MLNKFYIHFLIFEVKENERTKMKKSVRNDTLTLEIKRTRRKAQVETSDEK